MFYKNISAIRWCQHDSRIAVLSKAADLEGEVIYSDIAITDMVSGECVMLSLDRSSSEFYDIDNIAWHPNGLEITTAHGHGMVKQWDALYGKKLHEHQITHFNLSWIEWHPNGSYLAVGGWDDVLRILDRSGHSIHVKDFGLPQYPGLSGGIAGLGWNCNGSILASGHVGKVLIWDEQLNPLGNIPKVADGAAALRWCPIDNRLLIYESDNSIKIWDAKTLKNLLSLKPFPSRLSGLAWHPDGDQIAVAYGHTIEIRNAHNHVILSTIHTESPISRLDWSFSGGLAVGFQLTLLDVDENIVRTPLQPTIFDV